MRRYPSQAAIPMVAVVGSKQCQCTEIINLGSRRKLRVKRPCLRPRPLERQPTTAGNTPMPRPKQPSTKPNPPLRSAMRRPNRPSDPTSQIQRARTISDPRRTLNPMTRARTNSSAARDIPGSFHSQSTLICAHIFLLDHLFVSILGTSELRIQNANLHVVDDLRNSLFASWPHGVESESTGKDNTWNVNFMKNPWSASGADAIMYGFIAL